MNPRAYLNSLGKPVVTLPEIAVAIGLNPPALAWRLRDIPEGEHPLQHGAFKAGGYLAMPTDSAATWAERHLHWWDSRQQIPRNERNVK